MSSSADPPKAPPADAAPPAESAPSADATLPADSVPPADAASSPAAPPFPPWGLLGSLGVLLAFALTQLLVALLAGLLARVLLPAESEARASFVIMFGLPASVIVSHLAGWAAIYLLVVRRHRLGLLKALRMGRHPLRPLLLAFGGGLLLQMAGSALVFFFPPPEDFIFPIERFLALGRWAVAALFVMAVVLAPLLEEAIFRGVLLPAMRRRFAFPFSALVVTLLFTAMHAAQTGPYWPPLVGIALCGFFLAWWRERSGSLWPPIAFHAGFNFTAFIPLIMLELLGRSPFEQIAWG